LANLESGLLTVTLRPDGKCVRIEPAEGGFFCEGEVSAREGAKIILGKKEYDGSSAFFMEEGKAPAKGDPYLGSLEQGDIVRIWGQADKALFVERLKRAGSLSVTSEMEGARVFINGVYSGKTPCRIQTSPGTKELLAKAEGYNDLRMTVEVEPQKEKEIHLQMVLIVGHLSIASEPPGAEVYVGNQLKGKTPLELSLPPGEYELSLKLEGYYPRKVKTTVRRDSTEEIRATLTKMNSGGLAPVGDGTQDPWGPSEPGQKVPEGKKVTVLRNWPSLGFLEVRDDNGDLVRLAISDRVPLKRLPFGMASWTGVLPGEELVLEYSSEGKLEAATKTQSHTFSVKGQVLKRDGQKVLLAGDRWVDCSLARNVLIQMGAEDLSADFLSPGDLATFYGTSPSDIRFVSVEKTLGEKVSFQGYLVKTSTGLRIFNDGGMTFLTVPENLEVVDFEARKVDRAGSVPSGSRINFYLSPVADVVWAEYVWKAAVSLEGRIGATSGASFFIMPSWQEVFISDKTRVFLDAEKRPYYDIKVGDLVTAAGPSPKDIRFVWVEDRLSYSRIAQGFMTSRTVGRQRVFLETSSSGDLVPWTLPDLTVTFAYPSQRKSLSLREVGWGDRVKVYIGEGGKPVFGEVIEKNQINLKGTYLGTMDGFYYFSGFAKFIPRQDLITVGLEEGDTLYKGSRVLVGGSQGYVNYIEVERPLRPSRWVLGTVLSSSTGSIRILTDTFTQEFKVERDAWFCDWNEKTDGSMQGLFPGDKVSLALSSDGAAVYAERYYCPSFKCEGQVTYAQGRFLTIQDKSGAKTVTLMSDAYVERDGQEASYWSIRKGDRVKLSGAGPDWVDTVVIGR